MVVKSSNLSVLTGSGWVRHGSSIVTPPPPTGEPMLLGANVGGLIPPSTTQQRPMNTYQDWVNRCNTVGQMGIRRSYDGSNWNLDYTQGSAKPTVGHNITNWLSFTPNLNSAANGSLDGNLTTFAASIPSNEYVMLTIKHEPEDADPTLWKNAHKRAYSVIKANVANPAHVLFGPCFQGYTFTPGSKRLWNSDWLLPPGYADFVGIDFYEPYHYPLTGNSPSWSTINTTMFANVKTMCNELGVPAAIGELGSAEDTTLTYKNVFANPQHKIDWVQSVIDYAHAENFIAICYFDSYKFDGVTHKPDTDPSIILDSTTQFKNYWKSQCDAHPARTF